MDRKTRQNRTFEPYDPSRVIGIKECRQSCHRQTGGRQQFNRIRFEDFQSPGRNTKPSNDPFQMHVARISRAEQVRGKQKPPYDPSQTTYRVLRMCAGNLVSVRVIEQLGQDFASHSTEWERRFSSLAVPGRSRINAQPVLDQNYLAVGYIATVRGDYIYESAYHRQNWSGDQYPYRVDEFVAAGLPLYVDNKDPGGEWLRWGTCDDYHTVLIAIDGEVLARLGGGVVGIETVDCWLLDLVTVGGAVANIGKAVVKKSVQALTRKATKSSSTKVLTGRTREAAKRLVATTGRKIPRPGRFFKETGMPRNHFRAMQASSRETGMIAIVRNTNPKSVPLIQKGCPAKPLPIKANTDPMTGVVTLKTKDEIRAAVREGYYVVDVDGVARRTIMKNGKVTIDELKLDSPFWQVRPNQVIVGGKPPKPMTGDYDLMGVVDPKALGRNVALVAKDGKKLVDVSGPNVTKFKSAINAKLDQNRVMHGAQDQFAAFRGGATVFYPDGRTVLLKSAKDVEDFYKTIGRQTRKGSYNPNAGSSSGQVDELARMRARRAAGRR